MDRIEKNSPSPEAPPSLSDAIDRIMANPELISMVASALGKTPSSPPPVREENKEEGPPEPPSATPASADALATLAPILAGLKGTGSPPDDDRSRLLCALKPYVNPTRRDAIDTLLRFSRITELLKHLN